MIKPSNGLRKSKFFGTSLSASDAPPAVITFAKDQDVTLCFKSRPIVDYHSGFRIEMSEIGK